MMTYISQLYHYHAAHTARVIGPDGHRRTPSSPPAIEEVSTHDTTLSRDFSSFTSFVSFSWRSEYRL